MDFQYATHAEEKISERHIDRHLIEETVLSPDKILTSSSGRKIAQKIIAHKLLRVVYEEKEGVYIVITAYYTKTERYRRWQ
ncbi:MAG: DUF4258 domain-containing protein [Candidatus Micrarchaeota archaeon]|nr:DUF4258 domain-containing protein [Candidatus Micrarchaeota archaeon]MDE1849579.1 DUF4258 domain-containing protein [Candidatus Micrarchaeota archaeon]